jgi:hypothetical protein
MTDGICQTVIGTIYSLVDWQEANRKNDQRHQGPRSPTTASFLKILNVSITNLH